MPKDSQTSFVSFSFCLTLSLLLLFLLFLSFPLIPPWMTCTSCLLCSIVEKTFCGFWVSAHFWAACSSNRCVQVVFVSVGPEYRNYLQQWQQDCSAEEDQLFLTYKPVSWPQWESKVMQLWSEWSPIRPDTLEERICVVNHCSPAFVWWSCLILSWCHRSHSTGCLPLAWHHVELSWAEPERGRGVQPCLRVQPGVPALRAGEESPGWPPAGGTWGLARKAEAGAARGLPLPGGGYPDLQLGTGLPAVAREWTGGGRQGAPSLHLFPDAYGRTPPQPKAGLARETQLARHWTHFGLH